MGVTRSPWRPGPCPRRVDTTLLLGRSACGGTAPPPRSPAPRETVQRVVLPLGLAGSVEVGEYPIHELAELIAGLDDARRCVSWSALPLAHGRNRPTRSPARSSACPCKSCPADTRRKDSPRRSRGSQIRAPQSYAGHRSPGVGTTKQEGPHGARDAELART